MCHTAFFRIEQYFDFVIISAKNATLHKVVHNSRNMFRGISEIAGNPVLILSQHSLTDCFQSDAQTKAAIFTGSALTVWCKGCWFAAC